MATKFRFKNADGTTVDFEDYYVRADYFRSGNLWSWGVGTDGGLGDNTTVSKSSPVQTIASGSNWVSVAAGYRCSAATKSDGTGWLWGRNTQGALGDNTTLAKSSPVQTVTFAKNWKQIFTKARAYSGGIKTDGTLWMWGTNFAGAIGDNTGAQRISPVQTIALGTNWKMIVGSAGLSGNTSFGIKTDGTLWGWGTGTSGQLGDNAVVSRSSPVQTIALGTNWQQVSSGFTHTAAIKTDGTLWCWGSNSNGELGDNTSVAKSSPVQTITFATNWKQVSAGSQYTAAIKTDGTLWCWGIGSVLGDNTNTRKSSPVQTIAFGNNWKQVSCNLNFMAAVKTDGTLWTWGQNTFGQLGDNTTINRSSPVQTVAGGNNWKQVDCGHSHTVAIQYQDDYQ